ncbi:MAG: TlpA family protein disulfide reductase [Candidatus Manganitrophus sp. SA1]|nr:TlpA family protein disulfide reductase [Candidatus Manganitrophus morganii]
MKDINQKTKKGGASAPPRFSLRGIMLLAVLVLSWGILTGMGSKPPQVGGPAPSLEAETLKGKTVSLNDYRGKVVLLTFWATWCEPCKKEMPEIQAAYERYEKDGLVVLAVNFGEKLDTASSFAHHGKLTFPILLDRRANIAERFGVVSLPVTFFIDQDGIIRERVVGGTLTEQSIEETFKRLLKNQRSG